MRTHTFSLVIVLICLIVPGCAGDAPPHAPSLPRVSQDSWHASFHHACVAADQPIASHAGAQMLARGGNAVDAAVAASFTLSVVRPYSCGVGGGGFMVIYLAPDAAHPSARAVALNYRETTPAAIDALFYERHPDPDASVRGASAAAIPGTVAGLLHALEHYGTLDRATVLAPAIAAARDGFLADAHYVKAASTLAARFSASPELQSRFPFLWSRFLKEGRIQHGDRISNPEHALALELIARDGADAFYRGPIAHAMIDALRAAAGVMTLDDLASYRPIELPALRFAAFGHDFVAMPPPSSGGVAMAEALGILERLQHPAQSDADRAHLLAESFKHAFADRAEHLADPAFTPVPTTLLLSPTYLDSLAARVNMNRTAAPESYGTRTFPPPEDHGTSHISVADRFGNAVACTETINLEFGSLLAVPQYGFCINNEMDDFLTRRGEPNAFGLTQSDRNLPTPGKHPLSSMSPTIVLARSSASNSSPTVVAVAGASGGPRIITATTQVLLNTILRHMDAGNSVLAPRLHHQWLPDALRYERPFADNLESQAILDSLRGRGHTVTLDTSDAAVQLIQRAPNGNGWDAASDPRKGGTPAGY